MAGYTCEVMVREWLIINGFDGLCSDECGCGVDDFAPCGEGPYSDCESAEAILEEGKLIYYPTKRSGSCECSFRKALGSIGGVCLQCHKPINPRR